MANFYSFTDEQIRNEGMEVDFDLKKVFDVPSIEVSDDKFNFIRA